MKLTEEQIDFMRKDMACDFGYSKIIEATRERFKVEGRDFDKEFEQFLLGAEQ